MQFRRAVAMGWGLGLLALAGAAQAQGYRGDYTEVIRCESRDYRQIWCDADTRGGVHIVNQLSSTACVEGRTWGWDRRGVWVSGGCRGEFETGGGAPPGPGGGYGYDGGGLVRCESRDYNQIYCDVEIRGGVRLANQLSSSPCVEGRTWGVDRRGLWVRDGCRGEFEVGRGGGRGGGLPIDDGYRGQTVLCESRDNRYRHCPAGIRRGAELVRQLSDSNCVFNRSWGYDRNGVWVDRGCRGEFAVE